MAMRAFNSKPEAQQKALSASAPNKQKDAGDESRNAMIRMSPQPDAGEVLAGLVERVTYHNAENGFCVLRARARGHRDVVTVVGHAAAISAGEWIMASGQWINDRTHGQQFRARFLRTSAPTSAEGIERYLSSGMIRGVGPVYAKKLVRAFGEKVFDIIESGPDRLREVDGIGPVRAASILAAWAEQKAVREIMVFLHSHGVSTARAVRIFKTYGADAIQVMTDNPYRLARDIRGIGFKTADAIAMKLGVAKTAMVRVRAGISYALTEAMDEGHCGLPTNELVPLAEKLLEVPQQLIRTALELELQEATVIADQVGETPCVFLAGLYRAERTIAHRLIRLANGMLPWPWIDSDKAVLWVEKHVGLVLAGSQVAAIRLALRSKVLVMTGGPGVGKTTIIKAILRIVAAKATSLLLCAPTGRAAKRLTEATGFEAKTIHRLLEVDPKGGGFRRREDNPLDCDLLVIDEASMVDVMLMQALVNAVPDKAALLIVGDIDQLPSVGPGQVLADIISSGAVPVVRLTEVFRQAARSRIITSAHRINQGLMPDLSSPGTDSDFYFVQVDDPATAVARIIELAKIRIPKRFGLDPIRDIQVLCPMNRGGVGARSLNIELQAALNPAGDRKVERFGWTFAPGDKVMQIENDYDKEVYNGDIGTIEDVDLTAGVIAVSFDGRSVTYQLGELDMLVPAYAATIHKSQGSEYPAVIIPVLTQHYAMLHRNLLYTGVTRGKRLVVLVGQKKAIAIAVRNVSGRRRWSKLAEWLRAGSANARDVEQC
jgi:exodeoxyribonuclease V alpha subunit